MSTTTTTPQRAAIAHHDPRTGQYAPAIRDESGKVTTYSPTSFDEGRALEIARRILAGETTRPASSPGALRAARVIYHSHSISTAPLDDGDTMEAFLSRAYERLARTIDREINAGELARLAEHLALDPYALTPDQWASEARAALNGGTAPRQSVRPR